MEKYPHGRTKGASSLSVDTEDILSLRNMTLKKLRRMLQQKQDSLLGKKLKRTRTGDRNNNTPKEESAIAPRGKERSL